MTESCSVLDELTRIIGESDRHANHAIRFLTDVVRHQLRQNASSPPTLTLTAPESSSLLSTSQPSASASASASPTSSPTARRLSHLRHMSHMHASLSSLPKVLVGTTSSSQSQSSALSPLSRADGSPVSSPRQHRKGSIPSSFDSAAAAAAALSSAASAENLLMAMPSSSPRGELAERDKERTERDFSDPGSPAEPADPSTPIATSPTAVGGSPLSTDGSAPAPPPMPASPSVPAAAVAPIAAPQMPTALIEQMFAGLDGLRAVYRSILNKRHKSKKPTQSTPPVVMAVDGPINLSATAPTILSSSGGSGVNQPQLVGAEFSSLDYGESWFRAYAAFLEGITAMKEAIDTAQSRFPSFKSFLLQRKSELECGCLSSFHSMEDIILNVLVWRLPAVSEVIHAQHKTAVQHFEVRRMLSQQARVLGRTARPVDSVAFGANKELSERSLERFGTLVGIVTVLSTQIDAAECLRGVDTTHCAVPRSLTRSLVRDGFGWLDIPRDVGLSRDMPCRLVLFTDGLMVCALNTTIDESGGSGKKAWTIHEWIGGDEIIDVASAAHPSGAFGQVSLKSPRGMHVFTVHPAEDAAQWCDALMEPMVPLTSRLGSAVVASQVKTRRLSAPVQFLQTLSGRSVPMFGGGLAELMNELGNIQPGIKVPGFVHRIAVNIIKRGLREEGIFRVSGELNGINDLRQRIVKQDADFASAALKGLPLSSVAPIKYSNYNINVLAAVLKGFLRELKEPLLTAELHADFNDVANITTEEEQIAAVDQLLNQLPQANYNLLKEIIFVFYQVSINDRVNKMDPSNCGIVLGQNLLWKPLSAAASPTTAMVDSLSSTNEVVRLLIEKFPVLFEESVDMPSSPIVFRRKLLTENAGEIAWLINTTNNLSVWSVDTNGDISVWDSASFALLEHRTFEPVTAAACIDGEMWLATKKNGVAVFAQSSPTMGQSFIPDISATFILGLDGTVWLAGGRTVTVIASDTRQVVAKIEVAPAVSSYGAESKIVSMARCSGDRVWIALSPGPRIAIYDMHTRELAKCVEVANGRARIGALQSLGDTVWVRADDRAIDVYDADTFALVESLVPPQSEESAGGGAFPFVMEGLLGQVWSSAGRNAVYLWDAPHRTFLGELVGYHTGPICSILGTSQGSLGPWFAWLGGTDGSICVWEVNYRWMTASVPARLLRSPRLNAGNGTATAAAQGLERQSSMCLTAAGGGDAAAALEASFLPESRRMMLFSSTPSSPQLLSPAKRRQSRSSQQATPPNPLEDPARATTPSVGSSSGGMAIKLQAHQFKPSSFKLAGACSVCHRPLIGISRNGVTCQVCKLHVHKTCSKQVGDDCPGCPLNRPSSSGAKF